MQNGSLLSPDDEVALSDAQLDYYRDRLRDTVRLAQQSPDPSTQNAAMIVSDNHHLQCFDVNRFPRNVHYTSERWERPLKYMLIEHAERNAIYSAAVHGYTLEGSTMITPWAACADCARGIIQTGIVRLVRFTRERDSMHGSWDESVDVGDMMLNEAGVEIIEIEVGSVPNLLTIRRNGVAWPA